MEFTFGIPRSPGLADLDARLRGDVDASDGFAGPGGDACDDGAENIAARVARCCADLEPSPQTRRSLRSAGECVICQAAFLDNDDDDVADVSTDFGATSSFATATAAVCRLRSCGHLFHGECLRSWLRRSPTCPICRQDLSPPASAAPACAPMFRVRSFFYT
eukprot:TRINITY_DN76010_c0_g1_i1.p2 TRINITY_DN76010_c0_g1~~TRINITY_DN76010_c0_g1_i1.p2  ORF type:complete len:185 (-),score=35.34 TRINITY_DN76010_c0_g1_i1:155-640(-)